MGNGSSGLRAGGAGGKSAGGGGTAPTPMTVFERAGVSGLPQSGDDISGPKMADIVAKLPAVIDQMRDGDSIQIKRSEWSPIITFTKTSDNGLNSFRSSTGEALSNATLKGRLIPNGTPLVPDMLSVNENMRIVNGKSVGGIVGYWRVKH